MGQCFLDLVREYNIDFLGVQSHQHPGFNGEIVHERLDLLSENNNRLIITEFDSSHYNITERANDQG